MTTDDDNVPSLVDRLRAQIADAAQHMHGWDLTVESFSVEVSNRGRGPGLSLIAMTRDGVGFEEPILPGDDVPASTGQAVH
jgi:hypothetical protein